MNIVTLLLRNLAGRAVTLRFPQRPPASARYRGLVAYDPARCTGCGMCAFRCTSRAITFRNSKTDYRWSYDPAQCTYCGRCVDGCSAHALEMEAACPPVYLSAGALQQKYVVPRKPPVKPPRPIPAAGAAK
jgi:formate hydrogenlyase subunit 6/NADH:ubiquinone oxidoreductase subunit I